jgi:hypothetical protein
VSTGPSIREFVEGLDLDQLTTLVELANHRSEAKRTAKWVRYWQVIEDGLLCRGNYRQEDWEAARGRLLTLAEAAKPGAEIKLEIAIARCPPDELEQTITGDL